VQPFGKFAKPDGSRLDYPQVHEVPVYVMQGGGQTATFVYPINPGDECILFFSEQALDAWRERAESDTDLRFDLTNAMTIVGFFARPNPLVREACADNSIIIEKDGERIRLKKGETYVRDTAGQSLTFVPERVAVEANDCDIDSKKPVGIKGAQVLLGNDVLRPYWTAETAAWSYAFIPSLPLPPGLPIPPVPPLINMALSGIQAAIQAADSAAQSSSSLSIK